MTSNFKKSLGEIVSIEAWYTGFSEEDQQSDLFLHVRFQEAVFGGDPSQSVRFKLRLKKADIVVIAEAPISVPRSRVRRDRLNMEAKLTEVRKTELEGSVEGSVEANVKPTGISGGAQLKATGKAAGSVEKNSTREIRHSGTLVEHSVDSEGNNRWSFNPAEGPNLFGQAFNATEPVMLMRIDGKPPKIPPTVKVRVHCLREDIDVLELEAKNVSKSLLNRGIGEEKKLKLAEEIIKDYLSREGLEFEDVSEKFAKLVVADVIAHDE